ncbi:DUF2461 domain-containing protein [candidate division KSB1 bacterium]
MGRKKAEDTAAPGNFDGFTDDTFTYLAQLGRHRSDRNWFEANRNRYERFLLQPLKDLVGDLGPIIQLIDSAIDVRPQVNMTISRVFRDTRFSKSKALFRNYMWIGFKDRSLPEGERATFYFVIRPDSYGYGMGFHQASPATMAAIRKRIRLKTTEFRRIVEEEALNQRFQPGFETYKRPPESGYPDDLAAWFETRNVYYFNNGKDREKLASPAFVTELIEAFSILSPLYCFVMDRPLLLRWRPEG